MRYLAVLVALVACGDDAADDYFDIGPDDDGSDRDGGDGGDGGDDDFVPLDAPESVCPAVADRSQGECDPLTQEPCRSNEKCAWIWESINDPATEAVEPTVGRLGCACAGPSPIGGACTRSGPTIGSDPVEVGVGASVADDCERGAQCIGGICEAVCDLAGAEPTCDAPTICTSHANTFVSMGTVVAGTCGSPCDPLTQVTTEDRAACGSPTPDAPVRGCYRATPTSTAFACAAVPYAAHGLTDNEPALPGANGCEAGYIPVVFDAAMETVVRCHGLCAPAAADNTMPALAIGDPSVAAKLPNQAEPRLGDGLCIEGKKGSTTPSDCRFDSSGAFGVCFPYGEYRYDDDGDPATPDVPRRSCADLAPAEAAAQGCHGPGPLRMATDRVWYGRHVLR